MKWTCKWIIQKSWYQENMQNNIQQNHANISIPFDPQSKTNMQSSAANEFKINNKRDQHKPCKYVDAYLLQSTKSCNLMQKHANSLGSSLLQSKFNMQTYQDKLLEFQMTLVDIVLKFLKCMVACFVCYDCMNFVLFPFACCMIGVWWLHEICFCLPLHDCMIDVLWLHDLCFVCLCMIAWLMFCDCMIFVLFDFAWLHEPCWVRLMICQLVNLRIYMWFHHMFLIDMIWFEALIHDLLWFVFGMVWNLQCFQKPSCFCCQLQTTWFIIWNVRNIRYFFTFGPKETYLSCPNEKEKQNSMNACVRQCWCLGHLIVHV